MTIKLGLNDTMTIKLGLNDTMTFGKHAGQLVREVIENNLSYIEWALDEVDWFTLDDEAMDMVGHKIYEREKYDYMEDEIWHPGHPSHYGDK